MQIIFDVDCSYFHTDIINDNINKIKQYIENNNIKVDNIKYFQESLKTYSTVCITIELNISPNVCKWSTEEIKDLLEQIINYWTIDFFNLSILSIHNNFSPSNINDTTKKRVKTKKKVKTKKDNLIKRSKKRTIVFIGEDD